MFRNALLYRHVPRTITMRWNCEMTEISGRCGPGYRLIPLVIDFRCPTREYCFSLSSLACQDDGGRSISDAAFRQNKNDRSVSSMTAAIEVSTARCCCSRRDAIDRSLVGRLALGFGVCSSALSTVLLRASRKLAFGLVVLSVIFISDSELPPISNR